MDWKAEYSNKFIMHNPMSALIDQKLMELS